MMNASPYHEFILADEEATARLGARIAALLTNGDVIALYGDLGMGKTTFVRGLIRGLLGDDTEIPSPTYTIVQSYEHEDQTIWHFDLYRLDDPEEVIEIGFEDALEDIALIEWPEKAGSFLPQDRLSIRIEPYDTGRKLVLLPATQEWKARLDECFGSD